MQLEFGFSIASVSFELFYVSLYVRFQVAVHRKSICRIIKFFDVGTRLKLNFYYPQSVGKIA